MKFIKPFFPLYTHAAHQYINIYSSRVTNIIDDGWELQIVHSFCIGGIHQYGYKLLQRAAKKGLHTACYLWCLTMTTHHRRLNSTFESRAIKLWNKLYNEPRIQRIRVRIQVQAPSLTSRLIEGGIFKVNNYSSCAGHRPPYQKPNECVKCFFVRVFA